MTNSNGPIQAHGHCFQLAIVGPFKAIDSVSMGIIVPIQGRWQLFHLKNGPIQSRWQLFLQATMGPFMLIDDTPHGDSGPIQGHWQLLS
jgi:hypothetical protein